MNGFSASCGFTGGFTPLHPEFIKAAACGGGLPDEYDSQRIAALEAITGKQIDLRTYFKVPLYLYIGDQDGNYDADLWLTARQFYESAGANAQLVLYPGVGHTITDQMWNDLRSFFERHSALGDTVIDTAQKVYIGYYQRPADPGGLLFWATGLDAYELDGNLDGTDIVPVLDQFANSAEARALYGGDITSSNIAAVIDNIYVGLFGRRAEADGLSWWANSFNTGASTPATILWEIMKGAQSTDKATLENKLVAANRFTRTVDPEVDGRDLMATYAGYDDCEVARGWLAAVTFNPVTVPDQNETTTFIQDRIANAGDPILNR